MTGAARVLMLCAIFLTGSRLYSQTRPVIANPYAEALVFTFQAREKAMFGKPEHVTRYNTLVTGNALLMQRSGRRRLYDHNIFLRALFEGRIRVPGSDLHTLLARAAFIDIGSGILYGDGAPTVRDIYEDETLRGHLGRVVATDIEDPGRPESRYISLYRQNPFLPFPVEEVPMVLDSARAWVAFLERCGAGSGPVILRAVNTGPDLFYTESELRAHFQGLLDAAGDRAVLYLFSKFVLWKDRAEHTFTLLGEMDPVGTTHHYDAWIYVNWQLRTARQAFYPAAPAALAD